jgi:hypothetical protein
MHSGMANAFRTESPMLLIGGNSALKQYRMGGSGVAPHRDDDAISKFAFAGDDYDRAAEMMGIAIRDKKNGAPGPASKSATYYGARGQQGSLSGKFPRRAPQTAEFLSDPNIVQQVRLSRMPSVRWRSSAPRPDCRRMTPSTSSALQYLIDERVGWRNAALAITARVHAVAQSGFR